MPPSFPASLPTFKLDYWDVTSGKFLESQTVIAFVTLNPLLHTMFYASTSILWLIENADTEDYRVISYHSTLSITVNIMAIIEEIAV
jgi:hypothetical protein